MSGWSMGTDAWVWIGVWALVMTLVVWVLVREPRHARHVDPAEILRDRFARGEIDEAEFRQATAALDAATPPVPTGARHHVTRNPRHGQEAPHDRPR